MKPSPRRPNPGFVPLIALAASAAGLPEAASEPVAGSESASAVTVRFDAFVNWKYRHRNDLKGWRNTSRIIERSLREWYPGRMASARTVENGNAESLVRFLATLPGGDRREWSIVYLAAHQSIKGEWDFTRRKSLTPFDGMLTRARAPRHAGRIVILDACFAPAAEIHPAWRGGFAPLTLHACAAREPTFEVNIKGRRPVDFRKRFPQSSAWLRESLGKGWDGKLSFLGFTWAEAYVRTTSPPRTRDDWLRFLERCEETARRYRAEVTRRLSSEVHVRG